MPNLWIYEQNFNSLNDGDLSGQDSWSVDLHTSQAYVDVTTSGTPYEGTKHIYLYSDGQNAQPIATRTITAVESGTLYYSIKIPSLSGPDATAFSLDSVSQGKYGISIYFYSSGNIYRSPGGDTGIDYVADTYYRIGIRFRCNGAAAYEGMTEGKWQWNMDGGDWSAEYSFYDTGVTTIDTLILNGYRSGYFDYISPNYAPAVVDKGKFFGLF